MFWRQVCRFARLQVRQGPLPSASHRPVHEPIHSDLHERHHCCFRPVQITAAWQSPGQRHEAGLPAAAHQTDPMPDTASGPQHCCERSEWAHIIARCISKQGSQFRCSCAKVLNIVLCPAPLTPELRHQCIISTSGSSDAWRCERPCAPNTAVGIEASIAFADADDNVVSMAVQLTTLYGMWRRFAAQQSSKRDVDMLMRTAYAEGDSLLHLNVRLSGPLGAT